MTRRFLLSLGFAAFLAHGQVVPNEYVVTLQSRPARRAEALAERQRLRAALRGEDATPGEEFDTLLNGMAVRSSLSKERLERMPGVARVYPVLRYKPMLDRAIIQHRAVQAWELLGGINKGGEGIKIGIIDTGIDLNHPGFRDPDLPMPAGFPKVAEEADLPFTSNKVIVNRVYAAGSGLRDTDGHGTAVAMAAAGVPHDAPLGRISGIAPKAWLGAYRVFGDDGGATTTNILRALEDAVKDGMDVVNMSLGIASSGPVRGDPVAEAVERAIQAGVIVVVAAGNGGSDPNTVSSPATAENAIAVGNSWNERQFAAPLKLEDGRTFVSVPGDAVRGRDDVSGPMQSVFPLDPSGLACQSFPDNAFKGTVALILRGICTFEDKLNNVEKAGAIGAIVYTDAARPDPITMSMVSAKLPGVMVGYADGMILRRAIDSGPVNATLGFRSSAILVDPNRIEMSSSRGPSPDGFIKPELSAVGSPLYSADRNNGYSLLTGTSLSSPLVSGAAALVKQGRPGLTVLQYRSLLINSTRKFTPADLTTVPVNLAGSGILDIEAALKNPVAIAPATLSFGVLRSQTDATRQLTVTNLGTTADTFSVESEGQGRPIAPEFSSQTIALEPGASTTLAVRIPSATTAPGTIEGAILLRSAATGMVSRVPYWLGVPFEIPKYITILYNPATSQTRATESVYFRVTDENGLGVRTVQPELVPGASGGTALGIREDGFLGTGGFRASVQLGAQRTTYTFTIKIGDLTKDFSIRVQ